jgi:hypothetical protein
MKIDKQKTLNLFEKIVTQLNHDLYDKSYINILIRTTYRPTYFKKCIESILSQSYKKYKIIISYDDKNCLEYLIPYMNNNKIEIFKAPELDKTIPFFYNLYCNELLNHVKYGWILFLDDDDMLLHKDVLSIIAKNMLRKDNIILWKVLLAEKIEIYPKNLHNIKFGDITTCGLCFHSSYKNLSKWESKKGSDYIYFSKLFEKHYKTDKRIFLNDILTKTIHNRIGQTGEKQAIDLKNIIKNNNIKQAYISNSLEHLKSRFLKKYSLIEYNNNNLNIPTIFFGLYTSEDLKILTTNNINNKFIIFGGSEVANITKIKHLNDLKYISISRNIQDRLLKYNITSTLVNFNLVDHTIFKPLSFGEKSISKKIFVYNGIRKKLDNYKIYNQILINKIVKRLPNFEFIFSNTLNLPYEKMPEIYRQCFIGLRLTESDGNANMVQEMEAMNIPVVHNHSDYGLKWKNIWDIIKYINNYNNMNLYDLSDKGVDMFSNIIDNSALENIYKNIDKMSTYLEEYKNILFICSDYPGYGGAASNCYQLSKFYEKTHNVYSIYWNYNNDRNKKIATGENYKIINQNMLSLTLNTLKFKPDIIILKNSIHINLKSIYKCPIFYFIPGIYNNNLDKHFYDLITKEEHDKYLNKSVINQINNSTYSFCNSSHTRDILKNIYNIETGLFYSSFVPFYGVKIDKDPNYNERKYDYGLIVSDFSRKIKNVEQSIEFLKGKKQDNDDNTVILIGKGSSKYKHCDQSFECIENVEISEMTKYYKQIKYIVQDSFFESCSNVKIECLFNGCKIKPVIVISSTQYPGYGGAATNAYQIIKFLRHNGINTVGVFFHNRLDVIYDPEEIGGIFLYLENNYVADKVRNDVRLYLKSEPNYCLAKNYRAPHICKEIFNCYTVYLVSGINHFSLFYPDTSALELLDNSFIIDKNNKIDEEIKTCNSCDSIIVNSKLTYDIFKKIYPEYINKLKQPLDTTFCIKQLKQAFEKEYDIILICSNFKRKMKNNLFLIDVLKNREFDNYKKLIIGENSNIFKDINNVTILPLQIQEKCLEYMSKSKLLLHPAVFESNSNTIREAYYHKCLPMITRNVGYNELFPDYLICKNFTVEEWVNKIKYVLNNYNNIKNNVIDFNTSLDINKLLI